jgi:hypothetical protein
MVCSGTALLFTEIIMLRSVMSLMCINCAVDPTYVRNGPRASHRFLDVNLSCQRHAPTLPRPLSATHASRLITEHRPLPHRSVTVVRFPQYLNKALHCVSVSFINAYSCTCYGNVINPVNVRNVDLCGFSVSLARSRNT